VGAERGVATGNGPTAAPLGSSRAEAAGGIVPGVGSCAQRLEPFLPGRIQELHS
jgi:hypothetical protein